MSLPWLNGVVLLFSQFPIDCSDLGTFQNFMLNVCRFGKKTRKNFYIMKTHKISTLLALISTPEMHIHQTLLGFCWFDSQVRRSKILLGNLLLINWKRNKPIECDW